MHTHLPPVTTDQAPLRAPVRWPVGLALACGAAATALLFASALRLEQDNQALAFAQRVQLRELALKEGLENAIDGLRAVNQLFAADPDVTRETFRRYTLPVLAHSPNTYAVNYQRYLSDAERPAFEAGLQALAPGRGVREMRAGHPVPAGARARYRVVDYIEPLAGNEAALGLDTAYPADDAEARQRAYASGAPLAGDLIELAQGPAPRLGVLVSMPVYRHGAALGDPAARRAAVVGETAIVMRPHELVRKIYQGAGLAGAGAVSLRVYAGPAPAAATLIYEQMGEPDDGAGGPLRRLYPAWPARAARPLEVAGKTWLLEAWPAGPWRAGEHLASLLTLALGGLLTALGTALVHALVSRARHIQQRVDLRTAQLKELNSALLLRERAIESSTNAIVITAAAPDDPIVYVNPAFERITGYRRAEVLGRSPRLLHGGDTDQQGAQEIRAAIREQRDGHAVLRNYRKDGALFWNEVHISPVREADGAVSHFVSIQHDITAVKTYQSELQHQATHDALTGLPNRVLMQDRLGQTITHAARKGHELWVVSIDLDRFKFANGRLGHKGGDRLLQAVAARLSAAVLPVDTVVRLGGDEFALLLLPGPGATRPRAEDLRRVLAQIAPPFQVDEHELFLTASAGVAVYPADGREPDVLIERADIAMHRAKEMGRDNCQFFTEAMNERLGERVLIESAMRTALERREFVLHYQPQVDIRSNRIVGMEALIRWQHPELGMVAPNRFIGLAEETGLILPVGAWVLRTACEQLLDWQRTPGRELLRIAVNVSARQVAEQDFVASVAAVLAATGLAPACLELELTESLVMNDVEHAVHVMHELKKLGVKLAIDDFGTGYSSLAHLKRFEIDVLKIDQTFVRDLTVDPNDAAIVATIISLADNLGLEVISEGVETLEQLAFLRQHGCQQMQGYYFSRPVPAGEFEAVLAENEGQAQNSARGYMYHL